MPPYEAFAIESLFAAEVALRRSAVEYSSVEVSQQTIACRRDHAKRLRVAARAYAEAATAIERAMTSASTPALQPDGVTQCCTAGCAGRCATEGLVAAGWMADTAQGWLCTGCQPL